MEPRSWMRYCLGGGGGGGYGGDDQNDPQKPIILSKKLWGSRGKTSTYSVEVCKEKKRDMQD